MGWASGSELAADVWKAVRFLIPAGEGRMIAARKLIYAFEQHDCDTIAETEELCQDAGYVYDEQKQAHVYTQLPRCNSLCDIGVPCCECPKAPEKFLYAASAARMTNREHYLALARAALTPDARRYYMAKADNADPAATQPPAVPASYMREPGGMPPYVQPATSMSNAMRAEGLADIKSRRPTE
jgi:hypothetical protein